MARKFDLTGLVAAAANMQILGDRFERAFRRRPIKEGDCWVFSEPPGGLHPPPLLTVSGAMSLEERQFDSVAKRIVSFLSSELYEGRPPVPELHGSKGYGLLSELE